MSIECHHCELNDGNVRDDLTVWDDVREDDWDRMDVQEVEVVEEEVGLVEVESVSIAIEDDGVDEPDDETKQMVLIEMMIEARRSRKETGGESLCFSFFLPISIDEQMGESLHRDYVDCRKMNVMTLLSVAGEILMVVEDLIDRHLDHHHRRISMMRHSNHVHRLLNPSVICLSNM